jgi:hypothetical protein
MAILTTDIKIYHSGGASNSDPNASLGGVISSTVITDGALHNLFDKVSGAEALAGDTEYRCLFVKNTHATLTYQSAKVYIDTNTPSTDTDITISVATETGSPVQTVANENTAPTGQSFSSAAGTGNALTIGDLAAGASKAIWVKRVVTAGAVAYSNDSFILKFEGDTDA